jgi:cobalt/nickel transport system permease protein
MHIPDGFLSARIWVPTWLFSLGCFSYWIKRVSSVLKERMVPLMGVMAAFVFAAQMLNFPVAGGTSGHLIGGVLSAVLLGPFAGSIVISIVLVVQCLFFQDGGLTVLGANLFNMAFIGAFCGYYIYRFVTDSVFRGKITPGVVCASWLSVVLASAFCAAELAFSGTSPFKVVFPAMIGIHALIGVGEAVITALVVGFVVKIRPDLIYGNKEK